MKLIEGRALECIRSLEAHFTRDDAITIFQCLRGYEGLVISVDIAPGFKFMSERHGLDYTIVMD